MSLLPEMSENKYRFKNKNSCRDISVHKAEIIFTVLLKARDVIIVLVINNVPETNKKHIVYLTLTTTILF